MPDVNKAEYLRGLSAVVDALGGAELFGPHGDRIGLFYGDSRLGVSAAALASMTVTACHEYARWLPMIEAVTRARQAQLAYNQSRPFSEERGRYYSEHLAASKALESALATAPKEGSDA